MLAFLFDLEADWSLAIVVVASPEKVPPRKGGRSISAVDSVLPTHRLCCSFAGSKATRESGSPCKGSSDPLLDATVVSSKGPLIPVDGGAKPIEPISQLK